MKNHFKDKSKTDSRFTLAIGRFISHNQYRPIHSSSMYSQCGCEHLKLCWKRRYHSNGTNLHMDTTVIHSNTSAITSIDVHIAK